MRAVSYQDLAGSRALYRVDVGSGEALVLGAGVAGAVGVALPVGAGAGGAIDGEAGAPNGASSGQYG